MKTLRVYTTLAVVCLLCPLWVHAADGAIPVWQGMTITEPGKYVLTRNITGTITINSDGVHLNLNGFTLDADEGQGIVADSVSDLTIEGGTITNSDEGMRLTNASWFTVRRIRSGSGQGVTIDGSKGVFEDNVIQAYGTALTVTGEQMTVARNTIEAGPSACMFVDCEGCTITDNKAIWCYLNGMAIIGTGNLIANNVVRTFVDGSGLIIGGSDNHVVGNLVTGGSEDGFAIAIGGSNNVYRGNVARNTNPSSPPCSNPPGNPSFCDTGTGNQSNGDNFMPNKM